MRRVERRRERRSGIHSVCLLNEWLSLTFRTPLYNIHYDIFIYDTYNFIRFLIDKINNYFLSIY